MLMKGSWQVWWFKIFFRYYKDWIIFIINAKLYTRTWSPKTFSLFIPILLLINKSTKPSPVWRDVAMVLTGFLIHTVIIITNNSFLIKTCSPWLVLCNVICANLIPRTDFTFIKINFIYSASFSFYFFALQTILVSTLEKSSKKSPSPPPAPSVTSSNINSIKVHDEEEVQITTPLVDTNSVPLANSLDLSSDDDHLEKTTGASSSTTTTTSSSFLDNKRVSSFDDETHGIKSLSIIEQLKSSNTSLNMIESEHESVTGNEVSMRYRIEQQRKNSIPTANNNQKKTSAEKKVNVDDIKFLVISLMIKYLIPNLDIKFMKNLLKRIIFTEKTFSKNDK